MKKPKEILIGHKLQNLRKTHGYTQESLAEAIDCSTRYVSSIEQDKSKPSYEVLVRICNCIHITTDDIFGDYLKDRKEKTPNIALCAFDQLNEKNQQLILHLIEYFNKAK